MLTLRQKVEYLYKLGINKLYFRLILKQNKVSKKDRDYINRIFGVVENETRKSND